MTSNRTVYHVVPSGDGKAWIVSQENGGYSREFRAKEDAVKTATEMAQEQVPSQVKVHGADGDTEYESTYGETPAGSPG